VTVKVAIKENLKECGFSQGLLYSRYNPGTASMTEKTINNYSQDHIKDLPKKEAW